MAPGVQKLRSPAAAVAWLRQRGARGLVSDSRRVQPGDAFLAWPGQAHDARRFVVSALAAGAAGCLVEAADLAAFAVADERVAALRGLKAAAGAVASEFLGTPSGRLDVLAVTGTNGKTSTAWWLAQALGGLGGRCGVIGTLGIGEPPRPDAPGGEPSLDPGAAAGSAQLQATGLTTPDPVVLQTALRDFADRGFAACAIEASSIGLAEERLAGTSVKLAIYTNFTRDHLDHHGTMQAYWQAKAALFDWPGLQAAVVNVDDEQGAELAERLARRRIDLWTCSVRGPARLAARAVGYRDGGLCFEVVEGDTTLPVASTLIGEFNVANLLGVIGGLRALGVPLADAAAACGQLTPVPGRMQRVSVDGLLAAQRNGAAEGIGAVPGRAGARARGVAPLPEVVVDYAHTPDALEKALVALRRFARERGGRLWCVFGCGGNRDASKRPLMGALAERLADHVVITSDNPRDEPPNFIISQILVGVIGHDDVDVMEDRLAAIAYAVQAADARDVLLVAGKGHEDSQEIAGVKHPCSDVAMARSLLAARAAGGAS
jgi:UDP-N-acetylmuramoyl-L-alanyl-D-glutamate--2,6-diaminopimelate ligase